MVSKDRNPSPAGSPYRKRPLDGTEYYDKVDSRSKRQANTQTKSSPNDDCDKNLLPHTNSNEQQNSPHIHRRERHLEEPNEHNSCINNNSNRRHLSSPSTISNKSHDAMNPTEDTKLPFFYRAPQSNYTESLDYADENSHHDSHYDSHHDNHHGSHHDNHHDSHHDSHHDGYRDSHRDNHRDSHRGSHHDSHRDRCDQDGRDNHHLTPKYREDNRFDDETRHNDDIKSIDDAMSSRNYLNSDPPRSNHLPDHHNSLPDSSDNYSYRPQNQNTNSASRPVTVRCLITTKEAGAVIGKHGKTIADIRESTGAKIMISEHVQGAHDRVLTIVDSPSVVSKVVASISQIISDETQSDDLNNSSNKASSKNAIIKLLVPHVKMGIVIGKNGSRIREIQEQSSARIVASEELLPHSTERVVTIIGVPESIRFAVYNITVTLSDSSIDEFKFFPYRPLPADNNIYMRMSSHGGNNGLPTSNSTYGKQLPSFPMQSSCSDRNMPNYYSHLDVPSHHSYQVPRYSISQNSPHSNPYNSVQLQHIFIPNEMVGSIIGKQGCKINEIRQLSGCHIKIAEARRAGTDRLVTIVGSAEESQMALVLLYNRLENEKSRIESMNNKNAPTNRT